MLPSDSCNLSTSGHLASQCTHGQGTELFITGGCHWTDVNTQTWFPGCSNGIIKITHYVLTNLNKQKPVHVYYLVTTKLVTTKYRVNIGIPRTVYRTTATNGLHWTKVSRLTFSEVLLLMKKNRRFFFGFYENTHHRKGFLFLVFFCRVEKPVRTGVAWLFATYSLSVLVSQTLLWIRFELRSKTVTRLKTPHGTTVKLTKRSFGEGCFSDITSGRVRPDVCWIEQVDQPAQWTAAHPALLSQHTCSMTRPLQHIKRLVVANHTHTWRPNITPLMSGVSRWEGKRESSRMAL